MKRRSQVPADAGLVTWAWYSVCDVSEKSLVTDRTGLVLRGAGGRAAFWAVWLSNRPTLKPWRLPDMVGIVEGPLALSEAIGEADRACRKAKGSRCFAQSVGETFALRSYDRGARVRRSRVGDTAKARDEAFEALGLPTTATPAEVRAMFTRRAKTEHPDKGGTPEAFCELVRHRDIAAGWAAAKNRPPPPPPDPPARTAEQEAAELRIFSAVDLDGSGAADRILSSIEPSAAPPYHAPTPRNGALCGGGRQCLATGTQAVTCPACLALLAGRAANAAEKVLLERVRRVAGEVRERAQKMVATLALVPPFDIPTLGGFCMIASVGLVEALRADGVLADVAAGRCCGHPHWWVEVDLAAAGSAIVDITAMQFWSKAPPVFILLPGRRLRAAYEPAKRQDVDRVLREGPSSRFGDPPPGWWRAPSPAAVGAPRRRRPWISNDGRETSERETSEPSVEASSC